MKAKFINENPQVSGFEIGKVYSYRDFGRGVEVFYDENEACSLAIGYNLFNECFTPVDEGMIVKNKDLIAALSKFDGELPVQAIVMDGGYAISNVYTKDGYHIDSGEPTDIVCIDIAANFPIYIP